MKHNFLVLAFAGIVTLAHAQEKISLEQVIALSLQKNYDVILAKNTADVNSTNDRYAWAAFLPEVNAVGSTVWNNNRQKLEFQDVTRNNSGEAKANNINGSVQLNWVLFDGMKMFATRERIAILEEQGELVVKEQIVNTIASVITNYYNVVRQKQQLLAIQEQMAVSEERVKLAEKKLQVGTGSKPELLQAKVDFNAQRTQVLQQETAIAQLKEQLNALLGLQLPKVFDVSDTIAIDLSLKKEAVISNVENSNYSLLAAKRNFNVANLTLRERRAELYPVFSFASSYNYARTDNIKLINPFSSVFSQTKGFNYGFTINVPIFNGLNARRQVTLARINVDRQQVLYDQLNTTVNVNLLNSFVNYENAKKILLIEEETILLAKENVFIALEAFKRGFSTFIELRTAQQSLADAYNRLITARYNAKVAETELLRLNGGLLK